MVTFACWVSGLASVTVDSRSPPVKTSGTIICCPAPSSPVALAARGLAPSSASDTHTRGQGRAGPALFIEHLLATPAGVGRRRRTRGARGNRLTDHAPVTERTRGGDAP